jgi:hypothetical protein
MISLTATIKPISLINPGLKAGAIDIFPEKEKWLQIIARS